MKFVICGIAALFSFIHVFAAGYLVDTLPARPDSSLKTVQADSLLQKAFPLNGNEAEKFDSVFTPYKKFNVSTNITSVTNLSVLQQNVSYQTSTNFTTQYFRNAYNDSLYHFNVSITQLNTKVETMGLQLQYNSLDSVQQDTTSTFAKPLFDIVGKEFQMSIDSAGVIRSVDTSGTVNAVSNVLSGLSAGGGNFKPGNNFSLLFGKNIDSLHIGDAWSDSINIADNRMLTKYTVQNILHNEIVLLIGGTVVQSGTILSGGHSYQTKLGGTQSGKIIIERATKLIKSRNMTFNLQGTVSFEGKEIPATATSRINENLNPS